MLKSIFLNNFNFFNFAFEVIWSHLKILIIILHSKIRRSEVFFSIPISYYWEQKSFWYFLYLIYFKIKLPDKAGTWNLGYPLDWDSFVFEDYFDIVKNPMDLSTIKRKLDTGQYQEPWQYVDDVWLMFNNAWLYNRKTSRVYKFCSKLAEVFEQEIDPVMQSLGYCCGRKV